MLRKMVLGNDDFHQAETSWRMGEGGKEKLRNAYSNFRKLILSRLDSAIIYWFEHQGSNYSEIRQHPALNGVEIQQIVGSRKKVQAIWAPIDILAQRHWDSKGDAWVNILRCRAGMYVKHRAQTLKAGQSVPMEKAMKWFILVRAILTLI